MMNYIPTTVRRSLSFLARLSCLTAMWGGLILPAFADMQLAMLKTTAGLYTNVNVFNRTATHLSFAHAGGVAVLKLKDVDAESLAALSQSGVAGGVTESPTRGDTATTAVAHTSYNPVADAVLVKSLASALPPTAELQKMVVGPNAWMLYAVLAVLLVFWLFFCFCCAQICKKAGQEPGFLVWLPMLQLFPLLKAARMSGWWFVLWFVPLVNLVAQVLWCLKIAEARGKSPWVGIFLILPITNLFAFLYLAFSGSSSANDEGAAAMIGTVKPFAAVG